MDSRLPLRCVHYALVLDKVLRSEINFKLLNKIWTVHCPRETRSKMQTVRIDSTCVNKEYKYILSNTYLRRSPGLTDDSNDSVAYRETFTAIIVLVVEKYWKTLSFWIDETSAQPTLRKFESDWKWHQMLINKIGGFPHFIHERSWIIEVSGEINTP